MHFLCFPQGCGTTTDELGMLHSHAKDGDTMHRTSRALHLGRESCLTQGAEGCWALEPGRRAGTCWTMTKETSPPGGARRDEPLFWPIVSWGDKLNLAQRSLRGLGKEGGLSCSWSGSQGKQSLPLFHPVSSAAQGQRYGTRLKSP